MFAKCYFSRGKKIVSYRNLSIFFKAISRVEFEVYNQFNGFLLLNRGFFRASFIRSRVSMWNMARFSCISIENEWSLLKSMKKSRKIELSFTFSEDVLTQHWMSYRFCFNARYKTHFGRGILRIYRKNTFMKFFIHALILHTMCECLRSHLFAALAGIILWMAINLFYIHHGRFDPCVGKFASIFQRFMMFLNVRNVVCAFEKVCSLAWIKCNIKKYSRSSQFFLKWKWRRRRKVNAQFDYQYHFREWRNTHIHFIVYHCGRDFHLLAIYPFLRW